MEEYNINLKEYPYNLVCAVYQGRISNVGKDGDPWLGNPPPQDLLSTVNYMLESLDKKGQTVLRLRFQQDMSYGTIGEKLGLSNDAVRRAITKSLYDLWRRDKNNLLLYGIEKYTDRVAVKAVLQRENSKEKVHAFFESWNEMMKMLQAANEEIQTLEHAVFHVEAVPPLRIEDLNLPIRAYNCLTRSGYHDALEVAETIRSNPQKLAKARTFG